MNAKRHMGLLVILAMVLLSPGMTCRKLDPAGVYAGDQFLYETEMAITTSYDIVHTFVKWELDNRAALAKWPEINKAAVRLRKDYKGWSDSAIALRDAYELSKTDENRAKLTTAVALLRQAMTEAIRHMSQATQPTT